MSSRRPRGERAIELSIRLAGISAIAFIVGIGLFVGREAWPFLTHRWSLVETITSASWQPDSVHGARYGALALVLGTGLVTALAMIIAIPFGLLAAIYLAELCPARPREALKVVLELFVAVPSVAWGFIALTLMNPLMIAVFGAPVGLNALNAGLLLGLMSLPVIASLGEDALRAVPRTHRDAAVALGATRVEATFEVVVPAARRGLLAAVLLGAGRALGETMTVLMATGHALQIPRSPLDPVRTITGTIAAELGEAPKGGEHYGALFALGLMLFTVTFGINVLAVWLLRGRRP